MKKTLIASALLLLPSIAFAQIGLTPLNSFLVAVSGLEGTLIPILIAGALITFFVGLIMYLWNSKGDAKAHGDNKKVMVWGLVALFVMVSVWGIIQIAQQAFGITGATTIAIPSVPRVGN